MNRRSFIRRLAAGIAVAVSPKWAQAHEWTYVEEPIVILGREPLVDLRAAHRLRVERQLAARMNQMVQDVEKYFKP